TKMCRFAPITRLDIDTAASEVVKAMNKATDSNRTPSAAQAANVVSETAAPNRKAAAFAKTRERPAQPASEYPVASKPYTTPRLSPSSKCSTKESIRLCRGAAVA